MTTKQRRYVGDLHFRDPKVAALRGFRDFHQHDLALIRAWERSVPANADVFVLGDMSKGNQQAEADALAILRDLPGRKHLILGNHDRGHPITLNGRKNLAGYYLIFDSVQTHDMVKVGGEKVMLSHFPFRDEDHEPGGMPRYMEHRLQDDGRWLIHAHVHEQWRVRGRQICVSWDQWPDHFCLDSDVIGIMESGRAAPGIRTINGVTSMARTVPLIRGRA